MCEAIRNDRERKNNDLVKAERIDSFERDNPISIRAAQRSWFRNLQMQVHGAIMHRLLIDGSLALGFLSAVFAGGIRTHPSSGIVAKDENALARPNG